MRKAEDTSSDSSKTDKQDKGTPHAWFRVILFSGFVAFFGLMLISIYHPHLTERVKFFTTNALSLLVLEVILIQVLINRRQWEVMYFQADTMQRQLNAMNDQARFMSESLAQNERAVQAAEQNVELAKRSQFSAQLEAWNQEGVTNRQLDMMSKQTKAMQEQLDIMRETLAETRRVYDLTERPIIVVEEARIIQFAPSQPLVPVITIANRGRTAARKLTITIQIIAKAGWDYTKEFPDTPTRPAHIHFLAPGDIQEITGEVVTKISEARDGYGEVIQTVIAYHNDALILDADLYQEIVDGNEFCWIYGSGKYEDLSGKEYPIEEYAFAYYREGGKFVPQHYYMSMREKIKEQSASTDKNQENPS